MIYWVSLPIHVCSIRSGVHILIIRLMLDIGIPYQGFGKRRGAEIFVRNMSRSNLLGDLKYLRFGHTFRAMSRNCLAILYYTCGGDVKSYSTYEGI